MSLDDSLDVWVADLSPFTGAYPTAIGARERSIGIFDASGETLWLSAADGRRTDPPRTATPIATAWTTGLADHDPPPSEAVEEWASRLDPYLLRAQKVGSAVLLDQARGAKERRSLSWGTAGAVRRFRDDVHDLVRVESIGDRALLLDPVRQRLEILAPDDEGSIAIELPPPLAAEVAALTHAPVYRFLYVLPAIDRVLVAMLGRRVFSWSLSTMRRLLASSERARPRSLSWTFVPVWPRGEPSARLAGAVAMVAAGRTFIKAGTKTVTLQLTGPQKGEPVTLLGRLWDANGVVQYERLQLADGRVLRVPGAPELPRDATTAVTHEHEGQAAPPDDAALEPILAALRTDGLLRRATPEMLARYADGGVRTARDLLDAYYGEDEARMIEDGFLTHDWRFGQETDDVIAEICARLGGAPLFEQVAMRDDEIEVRDRAGTSHTIAVGSLDDVVDFFNAALAEAADPRRLVAFEDEGDQHSYLVTTRPAADRLRRLGIPLRA